MNTNSKQKVSIIAEEAGQEFNWQLIEVGKHHWQCQVATIQSLLASLTVTLLHLSSLFLPLILMISRGIVASGIEFSFADFRYGIKSRFEASSWRL